ncbi:uncharacterized protein TNCV_825271 [Trichonephila clavipes]|nr:uncharacterized protein TNCV_825271 [Trichonephila clavipes]
MHRRRIRAHFEQLSEFVRGRIIGLKEGDFGQIGESLVMWVEEMRPLEDAGKNGWTVADFSVMIVAVDLGTQQIRRKVFSVKSCFQLCPENHRSCTWRRPGQRADPSFPIARQTGPQQGAMVWGAISFEAGPHWSPLEAHLQHIDTSTA